MSDWVNHATIAAPRNATTSHTVTPSTGTLTAGTLFTPTAGRLLVCFAAGPVTSTTPSGWTLPTGGSAINNSGLYVWYRTAAGGDSVTTTHNGSNATVAFDFYEFATGSTFKQSVAQTAVSASGGAGPSLSSLTGTNWLAGCHAMDVSNGATTSGSTAWGTGTKIVDDFQLPGATDGYSYSLTEFNSDTSTSKSAAATITTNTSTSAVERLMFAVTPVVGATASRPRPPSVTRQAVNRAANF